MSSGESPKKEHTEAVNPASASESTSTTEQPPKKEAVDLTGKISKMKLHEFMSIPVNEVKFKLKGEEVEFILAMMNKVHTSLIQTLRDPQATPEDKQSAYDYALHTEIVYGSIFKQLKLNKPERADLN